MHYSNYGKPGSKGHTIYYSIYMTFWKRHNYRDRKQITGCQGWRWRWRITTKGHKVMDWWTWSISWLRWWLHDCIHLLKLPELHSEKDNFSMCKLYFNRTDQVKNIFLIAGKMLNPTLFSLQLWSKIGFCPKNNSTKYFLSKAEVCLISICYCMLDPLFTTKWPFSPILGPRLSHDIINGPPTQVSVWIPESLVAELLSWFLSPCLVLAFFF